MSLFDDVTAIAHIQALIDGAVRESEVLEYKTAAVRFTDNDKKEIAKDVAAMANSGGGLIIYGVQTDAADRTRPTALQQIEIANVETFERVVNSQVRPPIKLRKKLIPVDHPNAMLIEVLASEDPPHQSLYDKRYYRRSNSESLPMEHDLVALHFGRRLGPILGLEFDTLSAPRGYTGDPPFTTPALIRVFVKNDGRKVGRYVDLLLMFPGAQEVRIQPVSGHAQNIDVLHPGRQVRQFTNNVGVFHPFMRTSILEFSVAISQAYVEQATEHPFIQWTIFADEMTPRTGSVTLQELGWVPIQPVPEPAPPAPAAPEPPPVVGNQ